MIFWNLFNFRFPKISVECSVHILRHPWLTLQLRVTKQQTKNVIPSRGSHRTCNDNWKFFLLEVLLTLSNEFIVAESKLLDVFSYKQPNPIQNKMMLLPSSEGYTAKILEEFCELTSLHGFSFLNKANTMAVKLVWISAIIVMMGVGTQFIVNNTDAYINSRLVTNIESSTANLSLSTM